MRTKADLQQRIDDDFIWRRRELFNIRAAIQDSQDSAPKQAALLRAGVALLYAHWEGFIKRCGVCYLEFVSNQGKRAAELTPNFIAVKFKTRLSEAAKSKKASATHELVDFFCTRLEHRLKIPHKGVIDTQSNLSSAVLREIVWALGLDMGPYETKKHLIDSRLVDRRNHIAHGDTLDISVPDFVTLHEEVMLLMEEFRTQVQNAAATDHFLR